MFSPIPNATDNTNVNILRFGDDLIAMTETAYYNVIDRETLTSTGHVVWNDRAVGPTDLLSAHPHYDGERDRIVSIATHLGARSSLLVYEHAPSSRSRTIVGRWSAARIPYVHSFGLTPAAALLIAHPYTVNVLGLLWSTRGYVDHFKWSPSHGTRIVRIDRESGATAEYETDPWFVFHTVNAFEAGDDTVLDLLTYPDASIVDQLRVDELERTPLDLHLRASLRRLRVPRRGGAVRSEIIGETRFEFPSINYRRCSGREHRYVWGAIIEPAPGLRSNICRIDVRDGPSRAWGEPGWVFGEPVFVSRPDATEEDDGVILSVASHTSDRAALAILDARSLARLAWAEIDVPLPLGFHGSFVWAKR